MNPHEPETRCLDLFASEVRSETAADGRKVIRGLAVRYGSVSNLMRDAKGRPFREKFDAGVFTRAISTGADIRALVNHDRNLILGRNKSGTLLVADDADALRYTTFPPDSAIGEHYWKAVDRRDMTGVSFRFYMVRDRWEGEGEARIRTVMEADIDDISLVTYPAYSDTEAATRSLDHSLASSPAAARRDPWLDSARHRLRLAESGFPIE